MTYMLDPELLDQNRRMHEQGWYDGQSILAYGAKIGEIIAAHGARTILDYGCGKGFQYFRHNVHVTWGDVEIVKYDPAVPLYADRAFRDRLFDGVLCTDVLEHVPEADVQDVLRDVINAALEFVFASISCRPAGKNLPDGRNAHLTVRPPEWWRAEIAKAKAGVPIAALWYIAFDTAPAVVETM